MLGEPEHNVKTELESVMQARRSLERARIKLLRPTAKTLDSSARDLMAAVDSLRRLESDLASGGWRGASSERPLEVEIAALRRELQNVTRLPETAANIHKGWAQLRDTWSAVARAK